PKLEGDNSWDSEDPNGIMSTQELIKTSNEGGGFTYFDWPLPHDESKIEPKVSYSKKDPNWAWNIVAGTDMMDFNKPAQEVLALIVAVSVGALVLGILIIWMVVSRIANPINVVSEEMDHLASGDLTREHIQINTKDETGRLA